MYDLELKFLVLPELGEGATKDDGENDGGVIIGDGYMRLLAGNGDALLTT